ncbi:protein Bouncer-like isoform X2 [Puntigrus tetrazona]|uniref:protein Bouncer-like isoform X2 n=1 Tax=Puntigrus tetrazona TaxID=1606681 RepID=UPI001C893AD5|nr:protein Bouncer-like isoform X2 [Puntigrus tetrazona]
MLRKTRSAALVLLVLVSGHAGAPLICHYCPLQAAGARCNVTTECLEHERCSCGWRRYGRVRVLALQGCASPELCGSNRTLSRKGLEYDVTYACCSRDLCNSAPVPENLLPQLLGITDGVPDPPSCSEP